jgi:serine O-acetyltransferase
MIQTREELALYIEQDRKANSRSTAKARFFSDEVWKFQLTMRRLDYYTCRYRKNRLYLLPYLYQKSRYHRLSMKLGFCMPFAGFGKGLAIPHYGSITINGSSRFGDNCRIHNCVNIGATGGGKQAAQVGNNVYIGPGVQIVGDITIADGVCIGAGAVVTKSITEPNTTWAGCPAKKISDNSSKAHLSAMLFD